MKAMYPNEAVPDEIKDTPEYGSSVGAYIEKQWFGSDNRYENRRRDFEHLRRHMKGEVDISNFMDIMGIDKDASTIALDWKPPRTIAKFVNNVVDSFSEEIYGIRATGIDPINNSNRQVYTENLKKAQVTAGFTQNFNQTMGMNAGPSGPIPESNDELELHMQLDYHTLSEMAAELGIKHMMELNDYEEIKKQCDEDLVLLGEGGIRTRRNGDRITYERCVPENTIYSEDTYKSRDGRGTFYYGHVRHISIGDLKKFASSNGEVLTDEDVKKLASSGESHYFDQYDANSTRRTGNNYSDKELSVLVIDFCFKTSNKLTYKKKYNRHGGSKLIRKESTFEAPAGKQYGLVQAEYDVWYEGMYVPGVGKAYGYGKMDNQARKSSNLKEPLQPIVYYNLSTESIGSRILPYANQIYILHMKIQQLIAKMRPDGIAIDISAMSDIEIMDGKKYTPQDIITQFVESGNLIYDGEKLDGAYNPREPLRDLPSPVTGKLQQLIAAYVHNIEQIRADTGINEARDASTPSADALVGVQKMQLAASLNSTKHISRGILNITQRVADSTLLHLQMMCRYNVYSKPLMNSIGTYNADVLKELVKMGGYEYQIRLELKPTAEQEANFERDLQLFIQSQSITPEDVLMIREIQNVSLARKMLQIRANKRVKAMAGMTAQQAEIEAQKEMRSTELELKKDQALSQNKMMVDKNRIMLETKSGLDLTEGQILLKKKYGDPDIDKALTIEDKRLDGRKEIEDIKQNRLDKRSDRTKTQESELVDQRNKDTPPKNFESSTGSILDVMDL